MTTKRKTPLDGQGAPGPDRTFSTFLAVMDPASRGRPNEPYAFLFTVIDALSQRDLSAARTCCCAISTKRPGIRIAGTVHRYTADKGRSSSLSSSIRIVPKGPHVFRPREPSTAI